MESVVLPYPKSHPDMKRFLLTLLLVSATVVTGFSQKYGHVNFGNLLSLMPTTAAAEAELSAFNEKQIADGEAMVAKLEKEFLEVQKIKDEITPIKLREYEAKFQAEQERILKYEQDISMNLEKKRRELLGPIIQEARDAIEAIAKEKGYTMVFDSSLFNALLFTEDTTDLLPLVKAKLGIE